MNANVTIIGAGSFGCSLAISLADSGFFNVNIWGRFINTKIFNDRILHKFDVSDPESISNKINVSKDLSESLNFSKIIIIALPSSCFLSFFNSIKSLIKEDHIIVITSKGFELNTGDFLDTFVSKILCSKNIAVMSGPMFSHEIAKLLPSAFVISSRNKSIIEDLVSFFNKNKLFNVASSPDIKGVQLAGAMKNVIAIAAGLICNYGLNARAALITNGFFELKKLGLTLGCKEETFDLYSGLGDLVLTCTDNKSRNRAMGVLLSQGYGVSESLDKVECVVEGYYSAYYIYHLSSEHNLDLTIVNLVYDVLYRDIDRDKAISSLISYSCFT